MGEGDEVKVMRNATANKTFSTINLYWRWGVKEGKYQKNVNC